MCAANKYCCGLDLKYGCYFLSLWNVIFGIYYGSIALKIYSSDEHDIIVTTIYFLCAILSIAGGICLLVGKFKMKPIPMKIGLCFGFPLAFLAFLFIFPILIQIYHTVVVCTFISVEFTEPDITTQTI
ncbi:uncharacterized protein LOC111518848 [Drosophila willistoni]|uniref:uncharacterized protein LOC111518848 n=1 Tax=Drosophila willistoni TaxID=7260 RepID=UPI000C26D175|nr:uncharacterized protein LOC111518848 [Drosophila willistoni]